MKGKSKAVALEGNVQGAQKQWEVGPGGNLLLSADDFYISFRASMDLPGMEMFDLLGALFIGAKKPDGAETALATQTEPKWRILNGDFRKEYEEAFPDLNACIAVYDKHKKEARSDWSTEGRQ